jgi:hypothetical protein
MNTETFSLDLNSVRLIVSTAGIEVVDHEPASIEVTNNIEVITCEAQ